MSKGLVKVVNGMLRNVAVVGVKTDEDYRLILKLCEYYTRDITLDEIIGVEGLNCLEEYPVIYDDNDSLAYMFNWEKQDYTHCKLVTMAQFREAMELSRINL